MGDVAPPRVALVTGAAGGLGRVVVHRLAETGHLVALLDRAGSALEAASAEAAASRRHHVAVEADVADRSSVEAALAVVRTTLGPVTILVNAAGIADSSPLLPPDDALFDRTMAVNARGTWVVSTACIPDMVAARFGRIVNVASTAGLRAYRYTEAYVASKHAVVGLTRAMALDLASKGITVNAVCPGFMDTPMTDRTLAKIVSATGRSPADALAAILKEGGQPRLVTPAEVASAILTLIDLAKTGQAIEV